jgi:hypothetical protein
MCAICGVQEENQDKKSGQDKEKQSGQDKDKQRGQNQETLKAS